MKGINNKVLKIKLTVKTTNFSNSEKARYMRTAFVKQTVLAYSQEKLGCCEQVFLKKPRLVKGCVLVSILPKEAPRLVSPLNKAKLQTKRLCKSF